MSAAQIQRVGTSAVIVNPQKQILFVKRAKSDEFLPGIWELPGGGTEFGEDPEEALIREIREECGLTITIAYPLFTFTYFKPEEETHKQIIDIAYLCHMVDTGAEVCISDEHEEYKWLRFDDVSLLITDRLREEILKLPFHPYFQQHE